MERRAGGVHRPIDSEWAENKPMKLLDELADWWPLMSPPEEYAVEAGPVAGLLSLNATKDRPRLLDLGAGGGHLASHLKARFDMTLVDLSPGCWSRAVA